MGYFIQLTNLMLSIDKTKVYYLASPYTSKDPAIMESRYLAVEEVGSKLMLQGYCLIEPIAANHNKAKRFKLPTDFAFWKDYSERMVAKADGVIVLTLDGWRESVGVQGEIAHARGLGKPVYYIDEEMMDILNLA
jgi:hypothetical protein